jgi:hypothetical protein
MFVEYEDAQHHQQKEVLVEVVLMAERYIQRAMEELCILLNVLNILFLFIKE